MAFKSAGRSFSLRVTAGCIDVLYIAPDLKYGASALRVGIYVGTMLTCRLVVFLWRFAIQVVSYIYNVLVMVTLSLVVETSWRYGPAPLEPTYLQPFDGTSF
ncbi:hypothetical protein IWW34DRAFT_757257 [Fusarium oxysporum f. sp. albedinis]|nr:hypothetical protein IWW34DRAFT_757257 [Fusarium oxysporum f. sp. albedinis]